MKNISFFCDTFLLLIQFLVLLTTIPVQTFAEFRQYLWTKYADQGEKVSSFVSSLPAHSLYACALQSTAYSKFTYDYGQGICFLEPKLQNSSGLWNTEFHYLLTFESVTGTSGSGTAASPSSNGGGASGTCPGHEGYFLMSSGTSCIRVYSNSSVHYVSWSAASSYCAQDSANLLRIKTQADMDDVAQVLVTIGIKDQGRAYWLDGTDEEVEGDFYWGDASPVDPGLFEAGQPDNGTGMSLPDPQNCLYLKSHLMTLDDWTCTYNQVFICQVAVWGNL